MNVKKRMLMGGGLALVLLGCSTVQVTSSPSEADARADGESLGKTSTSVTVPIWTTKRVTVKKEGYGTASVSVPGRWVFNAPDRVNVVLKREFDIVTDPPGAEVRVNGSVVGKGPVKAVAIDDNGSSTVEARMRGWLPTKMKPKRDTEREITLTLERDGSGRRLIELVPAQNGVTLKTTAIFSDTEVGENSPNVSSVKRVTSAPQNEFIQDFSLLPDGKTMVVSILEEYQDGAKTMHRSNVWKMNTAIAGAPRSAITTGNFHDITPNASSDGKTLYFSTTRNGRLVNCRLNMEAKSGITVVNSGNTADYSPALRPDARELLYAAVLPGTPNPSYLWSIPVAERGLPSQLREGYAPQWSPDGKKLLYIKGNRDKNQAKIWVCDADGGNPTQLSMGNGDFNDLDARWSVDGTKIVFSSNRGTINGQSNYDIWMMGADGSNITQLTTNGSRDDKPVFGPDGKTVFFRSNRGLVWDIWVMKIVDNK